MKFCPASSEVMTLNVYSKCPSF